MSKLVLVIDDSMTVRKVIETCLGREGFEVKGFPDGIEALRWLIGPDARVPDLVLLDVGLPKMDGYEVARRLKSRAPYANTAIVMISRRNGMVDRLKGRLVGANAYLCKPLTTQTLLAATQSYIPSKSLYN